MALKDWTIELLNHQANSAKTPIEKVIIAFDRLKLEKKEKLEVMTQMENMYNENHNMPRLNNKSKYDIFANEQKDLINKWKVSKNKATLHKIIALERTIFPVDDLYTMYYYQYI